MNNRAWASSGNFQKAYSNINKRHENSFHDSFLFVDIPGLPCGTAAKLFQSCPTLCNPIDSSPPGSPVPEILQARTLEWVTISFSNAWKWKVKVKSFSRADSSPPHRLQPTRLLCPWDFPGKSAGVGCHCLLPHWGLTWDHSKNRYLS